MIVPLERYPYRTRTRQSTPTTRTDPRTDTEPPRVLATMARLNEPENVDCREAARQIRFVETSFGDTFPRATCTPASELRRRSSLMFVAPEVDKDNDTRTFDHEDASPDDSDDGIIAPPAHDDDPEDNQRTEEEPTADDLLQKQLAEEEERYATLWSLFLVCHHCPWAPDERAPDEGTWTQAIKLQSWLHFRT